MISKMLIFNPNLRISAQECLKSDYFDDIRNKDLENQIPNEIKCVSDFKTKTDAIQYLIKEMVLLEERKE